MGTEECFPHTPSVAKGQSEVLGATHNGDEVPFGGPFEIFIECSTQKLHQFHQN